MRKQAYLMISLGIRERKTLKVLVERKTFLIRLEGEQGGQWCSMTEISRGSVLH
ncbi:hypothetical protein CK203_019754 [Vitis vinifera]|uniref:Uncharacterized protein n=1 Tax=Vitis vinifera TaxID=29760 RepID=A0A438JQS5_VITVI|nr:hypothetical protein CK203_019754 [Vitis vinifera]